MKNIMKIVDVVALIILLIGGINYLIAGLFGLDLMVMLFGTEISLIGRIVYAVIGVAAVILLATIIARVITKNKQTAKAN